MLLRGAASVLITLVFCAAENNVPRWSKPDQDLKLGEWVPLNNDRLPQESARIPSAINPQHQINQGLLRNTPSSHQFEEDYQPKQVFGSQSPPPRIALLHPQSINTQPVLQPQIPSQQLLSHFLNQQIEQGSLPIFSRALLQGQPGLNPNYFPQQENYNLKPVYNQPQEFQNGQYNVDTNDDTNGRYNEKSKHQGIPGRGHLIQKEGQRVPHSDEIDHKNLPSSPQNEKEEVQILYVPVEMLKQQEQARQQAAKGISNQDERQTFSQNLPSANIGQQSNQKQATKFRHPIQPLKEQVPAYHLREALSPAKENPTFSNPEVNEEKTRVRNSGGLPQYSEHKTALPSRNDYTRKYKTQDTERPSFSPSPNKEQVGDESTIQDEVSDYRNLPPTRRAPQKDNYSRQQQLQQQQTTLPPPNQPPLSVFMETSPNNRVGDVLSLLKGSKTIPVLDSIGPDAPQVFVGPSNLNTPSGYIKYELPYLSSLNSNNAEHKLLQVPFFVAPLNFQPPTGFAKIPFPPPHIGSVVLSNITSHRNIDNRNIPTPSSLDEQTANYKESFTIPADISSISPQLPSLINSLQEDEFTGISSTESLTEPTEEPTPKYRRPISSRGRQHNRGSQRGYVTAATTTTTTRRPSSRQRRPSNRYYNQRNNHQDDSKENIPEKNLENEYSGDNYFTQKANRRPETKQAQNLPAGLLNKSPEPNIDEQHALGVQYTSTLGNEKQEQRTIEQNQENYFTHNPVLSNYPTDETIHPNDGRSEIVYKQGRIENLQQPMAQLFHDTRLSGVNDFHKGALNNPSGADTSQNSNINDYRLAEQQALIKTLNNYEQGNFQSPAETHLPSSDGSSSKLNGYEELNYRKNQKGENLNSPDIQNQKHNFRSQNKYAGNPSAKAEDSGVENTHPHVEVGQTQNDDRSHHRNHEAHNEAPATSYLENSDVQNTSPDSFTGDLNNYRGRGNQDKLSDAQYQPKYQEQNIHQSALNSGDFNDQVNNYEGGHIPQTPRTITEKPTPVRTRSRFRGKNYNQVQQPQQNVQSQSFHYNEEPEKTSNVNRNRPNNTLNPENDQGSYTSQNYPSQYSTTEQSTSPPSRKFPHGRGRRPLRPTSATTTTTTSTTTSAPPGKKYLIRTRKPPVGQTKLHSGRGRIRRPTTPTTTTTTTAPPPTVATDYPRTLPFQWRQPVPQEEYNIKEDVESPVLDTIEYQRPREHVQYQDERTSDIQLQTPQTVRHHPQTRVEPPRRAPNYSYEPDGESFPVQNQYQTTEGSHYSTTYEKARRPHYETTQKPHSVRDYDATQRTYSAKDYTTQKSQYSRDYDLPQKVQYSRDYETTQKPQYSQEYETTQKPHFSRDYETTQKPHFSRDYETTQKPHFSRDYETTQKPHYSRDYETTQKPHYSRDYETTRKPHHSREQEPTQKPSYTREYDYEDKPQYYKNYETVEKAQQYREPEQVPNSPQYDDYEATNKATYNNEFVTTPKPQNTREYETTRKTQTFHEYETTQNPYLQHDETPQKPYTSSPSIRNNQQTHRRRPVTTNRGDVKNAKNHKDDPPTKKEENSDFWNQAVTIQQSQSFVYTPDGNLSPSDGNSNTESNSKSGPLQGDYDDYYNFQEGGSYTSDQSPFPSNDQHITYAAKVIPSLEVGKASQYPEKQTFEKTLSEEDHLEKDLPKNDQEREEPNENTRYSASEEDDTKNNNGVYQKKEEPLTLPEAEEEARPHLEPELKASGSQTQNGRRRGTWVRVRVKKPKDVFETAESQRFSSVRENSLIPDDDHPKLSGDKSSPQKSVGNATENLTTDYREPEAQNVTTVDTEQIEAANESNTPSPETKSPELSTSSEFPLTSDFIYTTDVDTETDTQNEPDQNFTTISSATVPQETTTSQSNSGIFRTSTTTEISLETEICYKGKCIKTKRKKEDNDRPLEFLN